MSWTTQVTLMPVLSDALRLVARTHRLELLRKIVAAKQQAQAMGVAVKSLDVMYKKIIDYEFHAPDNALLRPLVPPTTSHKYVIVRTKKE